MAESSVSQLEHPVTVLIAEDEDLLRALLARTLWAEGYRTLEARDGGVALQLARQTYPHLHLVITDVVMPNVDGRQLGRSLAGECPGVPVIYISAYPPGDMFSRDAQPAQRSSRSHLPPRRCRRWCVRCSGPRRWRGPPSCSEQTPRVLPEPPPGPECVPCCSMTRSRQVDASAG